MLTLTTLLFTACDLKPGCKSEETCGDGTDNDCDGLIDCEDGDCFLESVCDDALGSTATVTGGTISQHAWYHRWTNHPDTYWDFQSSILSITGTVRVVPMGQSDLATASTSSTCDWSIERMTLLSGLYREGGSLWDGVYPGVPTREGFWIEEDCRISGSDFLPEMMVGYHDGANAFIPFRSSTTWRAGTFTPWYNATLATTWQHTSTYTSTWTPGNYQHFWRQMNRTGSVLGGVDFIPLP